ncbi:3'-5' exonuclease-like [Lolium perenne]|uniref:3'-5' exonuclease-like n=1 Tax=Lolium perenne TaxID=4522 RepID=UPI0021EA7F33|nr:3'-5' exonuclease-like [Lolium perenne]
MATSITANFGDGNYMVAFDEDDIFTTYTASGDTVNNWLSLIYRIHRRRLDRLIVGLDVEWRPSFTRGVPRGRVALLQICVGRRCLVFQILRADYIPDTLHDFLEDDRFTFVGVGIHGDVGKLRHEYGLEVGSWQDLRYLAAEKLGKPALQSAGLQTLVWEVMDVWPEKPHHVRVSDWDAPRLTAEQLMYACADAFMSFEVGRRLYDDDY